MSVEKGFFDFGGGVNDPLPNSQESKQQALEVQGDGFVEENYSLYNGNTLSFDPNTGFPDLIRFPDTYGYPAISGGTGRREGEQADPLEEMRAFYVEYFGEDWKRRRTSYKQRQSIRPDDTVERIQFFIAQFKKIDWSRQYHSREYDKGSYELARIQGLYQELYRQTMRELLAALPEELAEFERQIELTDRYKFSE